MNRRTFLKSILAAAVAPACAPAAALVAPTTASSGIAWATVVIAAGHHGAFLAHEPLGEDFFS